MDLMSLDEIAPNKDQTSVNRGKIRKKISVKESRAIIIVSSIINPRYTPAITIVELCKRAEIGVGADIAFNNQEKNGNWADFEKKIIWRIKIREVKKLKNGQRCNVKKGPWKGRDEEQNREKNEKEKEKRKFNIRLNTNEKGKKG